MAKRIKSTARRTRRHNVIPHHGRAPVEAAISRPRPRQRNHSRRPGIRNHHSDSPAGQCAGGRYRAPRAGLAPPTHSRSCRRRVVAKFVTLARKLSQLKAASARGVSRRVNRPWPQPAAAPRTIERTYIERLIRPGLEIAARIHHPLQPVVDPETQSICTSGRRTFAAQHCVAIARVVSQRYSLPGRAVRIAGVHMQVLRRRPVIFAQVIRIFLEKIRKVRTRRRRRHLLTFVASATFNAPFDPSVTFDDPAATAVPFAPTNAGHVITRTPCAGVPSARTRCRPRSSAPVHSEEPRAVGCRLPLSPPPAPNKKSAPRDGVSETYFLLKLV